MADTSTISPTIGAHGAKRLPAVEVASYSLEVRGDAGFLGEKTTKGAFRAMLENGRKVLRKHGDDPFGDEPTEEISKKTLDTLLKEGDPEAAGVLQGAIEEFAQELALVISQFVKLKSWRDVERLVIGGGFLQARVGELAIGRTSVILKAQEVDIAIQPIRHVPHE